MSRGRRSVTALILTREQVLAHRRRAQSLDDRLPAGPASLRRAAWAGLQDSVPRSALHALHARVAGVGPDTLDDPALVQVWGPRYTAFVVPADGHLPFTLGRLPVRGRIRERARSLADRLHDHLGDREALYADAGAALGVHPNSLRYAALTGRVLIRWDGARQATIRVLPPPDVDPDAALEDLVRRYLHVYGPSTPDAFVRWGGLDRPAAAAAFDRLAGSLVPVRTPLGEALMLADDEPVIRRPPAATDAVRLLPSGDPYFLLWGPDRDLVVADPARRDTLWTPRVWPGALLVGGEIAGTWRRAEAVVVAAPWRRLAAAERAAVEAEAAELPLPAGSGRPGVRWEP